jgi:serine/threonine protein kinase/tetratricopeptide (TPR) repeat protein
MVPEPQHDTDPVGFTPSSARCRACGRRIAGFGAGCPVHGRAHASGAPTEDDSPVAIGGSPSFPGYRVTRLLGRGGFGVVYEAEPLAGGPSVAIKIARPDKPEAAPRFVAEIAALSAVGPPHVPEVFEHGQLVDGTRFVVMERVDAPTLADRLLIQAGPMPLTEAVPLIDAALVALAAIHARGFVHRDLKPENVFVDGALQAKIVDLGLAFAIRETADTLADGVSSERTIEGAALGTAEYMSPEQCEGLTDVDPRTDIYTVGVVLYELLAGRPPFWGPPAVVQQYHRGQRPPRLSGLVPVPPALEAIVHRCLAKDREERPESVEALRDALRDALAEHAREADRVATPATIFFPPMEHESDPPGEPLSRRSPSRDAEASGAPMGRERRRVGILYFRSPIDVIAVQRRLLSLGAELAYTSGDRFVAVYSHEVGDNPARRALRAGRELVKVGVCERALVDLAAVSVQVRPDGGRRFWSPLFAQVGRFAAPDDPDGVFATIEAAAAIPELAGGVPSERGWVSTEGVLAAARSDPQSGGLAGRALVGRDDVIAALIWSARRSVARAMPGAALVIAEAGHGKSHLGQVLLDQLGGIDLRAEVIDLRARPPDFGDADRTLRELLQRAIGVPSSASPEAARGLLEHRLGPERSPLDTAILAFSLGWIGAAAPELRALAAAPGALRPAMATSAGEALRRRARRGPIFVVLDDAHHADETTLAALEYAALAEASVPIWICALGRPPFEEARPSWGDRAASREVHRLGPLDRASAAALCRKLLLPAESVPELAVAHLVARTQAVPLLLVELVRGLKRAGVVRRHPRGESWFLATDELDHLPDLPLIEWLAQTEMDQLSPSLRAHARLVALLGGDATGAEIDGVLRRLDQSGAAGDLPLDARVGTRRLLSAGLLVQHREGRIGFRHALVREAIAAGTPAVPAHRIHLAAAEYYRDAHAIPDERRLLQLASHAAAAGLGAIAEGAYLKLAESAQARHAYIDAERRYSGAIAAIEAQAAPDRDGASGRAMTPRRGRGRMRQRLGRYDEALTDFAAARELARAAGDATAEVEILLDEATALDWMNDYARSEERVIAAETLARERGLASPAIEASLLLGLGRSRHRYSREDEAAPLIELASELALHLGDDGYETRVVALLMLGFINQGTGRLDDAARVLDEAVAICEAHEDRVHLFVAMNNRAMLRACLGDKAGMVAGFTRALALARELGQPMLEIVCHYNLGEILFLMDDLDAAEPYVSRAIQLERARVGAEARAEVTLLDARVHLFRGDEDEARALASRLRRESDAAKAAGARDPLQVPSEDVLCTMIDLATGDADAAAWDALEQRSAVFSVGQEHVEVLEARALAALRRGDLAAARAQLLRAIAAAARIPNVMGERLRRALAAASPELASGVRAQPPQPK